MIELKTLEEIEAGMDDSEASYKELPPCSPAKSTHHTNKSWRYFPLRVEVPPSMMDRRANINANVVPAACIVPSLKSTPFSPTSSDHHWLWARLLDVLCVCQLVHVPLEPLRHVRVFFQALDVL